jgi:hypothetical protein
MFRTSVASKSGIGPKSGSTSRTISIQDVTVSRPASTTIIPHLR